MVYNFKRIQVVPSSKDFIDIVLSKTQRKTPTVVHPQFHISRIRKFYIRKIKYTQQNFHDKLDQILADFPLLDDIHPFHADLLNVLYDRDHYKVALGQLSTARRLVDNIATDYTRLVKFGDSLFRCKELKRIAMGRMATVMKKQTASLAYLEHVRQHLSRLPTIDPTSRTLVLCGYPNVGKSSFINKITRADVEVQPFEFTTKSLFVGHTDFKDLRWQVIDTPGLLDHPLEDRNTIEMQTITALAHLRAAIIFIFDLSATCGYSIEQQVQLFDSLRPLFANKPIVFALNKTDVTPFTKLPKEDRQLIQKTAKEVGAYVRPMSTFSEEGLSDVKTTACTALLEMRVEAKMRTKRVVDKVNRLQVTMPVPRDRVVRDAFVPETVRKLQENPISEEEMMANERKIQQALKALGLVPAGRPSSNMGKVSNKPSSSSSSASSHAYNNSDDEDGLEKSGKRHTALRSMLPHLATGSLPVHNVDWVQVPYQEGEDPSKYSIDWRKDYELKDPSWRFDNPAEIYNGENVYDYVDPEIDALLAELEREEDARLEEIENAANSDDDDLYELAPDEKELLRKIRRKKKILRQEKIYINHNRNRPILPRKVRPRSAQELGDHLTELGLDGEEIRGRLQEVVQKTEKRRSRSRTVVEPDSDEEIMDDDEYEGLSDDDDGSRGRTVSKSRSRSRSKSRSRSHSVAPGTERKSTGMSTLEDRIQAERDRKRAQKKMNLHGRKGEADRHIAVKKPRHLFAGKRGMGKTDRR